MTFKRRILLFGFGICCSVALGTLALVLGLLSVHDRFDQLMARQVEAKVQTLVIGREVNFVSRLTRNIMLGSNLEKDLKSLDETVQKIERGFAALHATATTPAERDLVQKAEEATLAFVRDGRNRMLPLRELAPEKRAETFKDYEHYATPLAMKSREAFAAIIEHADKGFAQGVSGFDRWLDVSLKVVITASILFVLLTAGAFAVLLRAIRRPILVLTESLGEIRSSWNLTRRLDASAKDEMGDIARETNAFLEALHDLILAVRESSTRVASGSTELSATASEVAKTSSEIAHASEAQRQNSERTAAAMTEFNASIQEVGMHIRSSQQRSDTMLHAAEQGAQQGQATVEAMRSIQSATQQMIQAVGVIQDLARQTNLLSLNAAIEAAKAGEHGKGFAVVAEEVRKLAEHSAQAARQIGELIGQSDGAIKEGVRTVEATAGTIRTILENIQVVARSSTEIGVATEEQGRTADEVTRQVEETSTATERSAAAAMELSQTVEEVNRTAEHLAGIAEGLAASLAKFRTA